MSAIYEVTVEVEAALESEFLIWLKRHIQDIVNEAGFESAQVFALESGKPGLLSWCTHYHATNRAVIDAYIEHLAPKFRADAVKRFAERVRVSRRILESVPDLTVSSEKSQIVSRTKRKD